MILPVIGIEFTTFSLIDRCERTGMFGIAIATSEMAVGSHCIHVAPGVGGLAAARMGSGNRRCAGHRVDRNVVVAANAVVSAEVADAMFSTFQQGAELPLSERLLRALEAGKTAGSRAPPARRAAAASMSSSAALRHRLPGIPWDDLSRYADRPIDQYRRQGSA